MIAQEVAKILTVAAELDNRVTVTVERVKVWHRVLAEVDFEAAQRAVIEHYQESTESLLPAHIVSFWREWRLQHANDRPVLPPDEDALCRAAGVSPEEFLERREDAEWVAVLKQRRDRVLRGDTPHPGITTLGTQEGSRNAAACAAKSEKKGISE